ncbi:TetR family transcriptional regulator [Paenibacillus aurantius]|uniref:TetR family transcriptional regulator n=1 Tax=Paenibacillus aurantius TaxID=2918900 RepID=A0AA96LFI0_9BACL|nr:TetR family transcriptional regulator [Paenibacillus aurantius]WNQ11165.1 TetR family transcriptional regulator [Paenibacillus aurantius]
MKADDTPKAGLRERKKQKTKAAIQHHALRLFKEQGYQQTTTEQIAEAAEVSPSTLFRYFPTKEALVLEDDFDPYLIEAFRSQPQELTAVQALRETIRQVASLVPEEERLSIRERMDLSMSVPELKAAALSHTVSMLDFIARLIAEREGKGAGEPYVLASAGALIGVILSAHQYSAQHPGEDFLEVIDRLLGAMEEAPLGSRLR